MGSYKPALLDAFQGRGDVKGAAGLVPGTYWLKSVASNTARFSSMASALRTLTNSRAGLLPAAITKDQINPGLSL